MQFIAAVVITILSVLGFAYILQICATKIIYRDAVVNGIEVIFLPADSEDTEYIFRAVTAKLDSFSAYYKNNRVLFVCDAMGEQTEICKMLIGERDNMDVCTRDELETALKQQFDLQNIPL